MQRVRALVAIAFATLLVAACGSDTGSISITTSINDGPVTTTAATRPPRGGVTTSVAPSATPSSEPTEFATAPVSVESGDASGVALLTAVRAASQDGFDRVTFEFANHLPGYAVAYVQRPIVQDASGTEMAVDGAALLQVRMTPASGADLSAGGVETYVGPDRFDPGTSTLVEVVRTGDFEANLTWVVGVAREAGFKVSTLDSPPRLVIDVDAG